MTSYPFTPSPLQNQVFNPILGGNTYTATITWNLFGQRWYLNLTDSGGNLIISTAVVSSQDPQQITSISWDGNVVTIETAVPHWIPLGALAQVYLSANVPDDYNGMVTVTAAGPTTLTYELDTDPGQNTVLGNFGSVVDLSAGLVPGSMLLYYASTGAFATTP